MGSIVAIFDILFLISFHKFLCISYFKFILYLSPVSYHFFGLMFNGKFIGLWFEGYSQSSSCRTSFVHI